MDALTAAASPEGLASLVALRERLRHVNYAAAWRRRVADAERLVALSLGYQGCDACDRWVDPDENPVHVYYDGNGDPDVGVCRECCEESEAAYYEESWPTDAQMREDDDLVADSI